MPPFLALLTAAAAAVGPTAHQPGDTLEAIRRVDFLLVQRYRSASGPWSRARTVRDRDRLGGRFDLLCDADRGDVCFADDPDAGRCPNLVQCHPSPGRLVETLVESVRDPPESGYLLSQAVYLLGKLERLAEALELVERCRAASWWCSALRAYVLHGMVRDSAAWEATRAALGEAPDSVGCALVDATWVTGQWNSRGSRTSVPEGRRERSDWDCGRRAAHADTLWWLADPLYGVPGNDRLVEHVARSLGARFHAEIRRALPTSPGPREVQEHLRAERIRRGQLDSYDTRASTEWTSRAAARYHFVPEPGPDGAPTWRLEAQLDDEGYTPPLEPFLPVPHQLARFRSGDSLRIAAAARLAGTPLERPIEASAVFALTDGPASVPLLIEGDGHAPTVRFLAGVPARPWVAGLEVVTSKGVGWNRQWLEPLGREGAEISDLLLFEPAGPEGPAPSDVAEATALMLGSTALGGDREIGVYWETYGLPSGAELRLELTVERATGGLVDRLRRLLPGGTEEGRGRISWAEPTSGDTHRSAVTLDLGNLAKGGYTLVLRATGPGAPPLQRRRAFTVD